MNAHQTYLARQQRQMLDDVFRGDLYAFVQRCFEVLHPVGDSFRPNWHVEAICYALQRVMEGDCTRLLITVPPRHLKSISAAVAFPAFLLGRQPGFKIIAASYGHDLAERHARDTRIIMESDFYRRLFPATRLEVARSHVLETAARGFRRAVSVTGAVTGHGADLLIIDDVMKAADAQSEVERQRARDFVDQTLFTRLNNKETGAIVAIQQRLHEDDVAAHLLAKGTFEHLNLTAIAENDEIIAVGPGRFHTRERGEALFPQQEPLAVLERMRRDLGPVAFSAQYQQNPVAPGGNLIRWEHWGNYDRQPDRDTFQRVVQSWDTALSAAPTSDWSVCTSWGYREGKWYLLDLCRVRLDYGDLKREVIRRMNRWNVDHVVIENAGTGIPLIRELIREGHSKGRVFGYTPRVDKVTRAATQCAKLETGDFLLPTAAAWLEDFRHECLAFPNGRHDDQVDSLTQFLDWLSFRRGMSSVREADQGRARRR
jgi:predicted phage terminase large subunit-like protein